MVYLQSPAQTGSFLLLLHLKPCSSSSAHSGACQSIPFTSPAPSQGLGIRYSPTCLERCFLPSCKVNTYSSFRSQIKHHFLREAVLFPTSSNHYYIGSHLSCVWSFVLLRVTLLHPGEYLVCVLSLPIDSKCYEEEELASFLLHTVFSSYSLKPTGTFNANQLKFCELIKYFLILDIKT